MGLFEELLSLGEPTQEVSAPPQQQFLEQEIPVAAPPQPTPEEVALPPLQEAAGEPIAPEGFAEPTPGFGTLPRATFEAPEPTAEERQRETFTKIAKGLGPDYEALAAKGEFQKIAQRGLEVAADEGLTARQFIQRSAPEAINVNQVEQKLTSLARGMTGTIGGFLGFGAYLFDSDISRDLANKVTQWNKAQLTGKEDIFDEIAQAGGSSAAFWIPGFGIATSLNQVARVSIGLARWGGAITAATIEGIAEAGNVYNEVLAETGSKLEAEKAARTVFLGNIPISVITNRLGIFADKGGAIKRKLLSALLAEIPQEISQEALTKFVKTGEVLTLGEAGRIALVTAPVALLGGAASARLLPKELARISFTTTKPDQINRAISPTGKERLFRYQVKDLSEIEPTTGTKLQRRQRGREASKAQVAEIVRTFIPDIALEETLSLGRGTIIVQPDNKILSGHGRREALIQLKKNRPEVAAEFSEEVKRRAAEFGLENDPKLAKAEFPVIVREALPDQDFQAIADEANIPEVAGFSASELAATVSDKINPRWLQDLKPVAGGINATIESPQNRETIRKIVAQLPVQMQNEFRTSGGQLSKQGIELVRSAIFNKAYNPGVVLNKLVTEETDPGIKNVLRGMMEASPKVASVKVLPRADLDISQDIAAVAEKMSFAKKQGVKVEDIINQRDFIQELSPVQIDIFRAFEENKGSAKRVREVIEKYYDLVARQPDINQSDIFGKEPETKESLLKRTFESEQIAFAMETEPDTLQAMKALPLELTSEVLESIDPTIEEAALSQGVFEDVEQTEPVPKTPDTMPKRLLTEEKGAVTLEPLVKGLESLESAKVETEKALNIINRIFTRHVGLDEGSRQAFINLEQGQVVLKRASAKAAALILVDPKTEKLLTATRQNELYRHLQEPEKFAAPEGLQELADTLHKLSKRSFLSINNRFLTTEKDKARLKHVVENNLPIPPDLSEKLKLQRFPDVAINRLQAQREKIIFQLDQLRETTGENWLDLEPSLNPPLEARLEAQLLEINKQINRMETITYFHQITEPEGKFKKIVGRRSFKNLSRNPKAFLGRKYATREDAIEAGRKVAPLDTAVAEVIYETEKFIQTDEFIKAINRNPEFSAEAATAPDDWVSIDERIMPSGKFRKYNPIVARAIEELTFTGPGNSLVRGYDKVNSMLKMVGFYNPIFMARFNVSQGIRAVGPAWIINMLPKVKIDRHGVTFIAPEAVRIWREKGATWDYLAKNGLFNNVFDLQPAMEDVMREVRDVINKTPTSEKFKRVARENLNPVKASYNTWKYLNESTWEIDGIQRINTWLLMRNNPRLKRYYSDFEIIELANDFHANYGKIPKATRKVANRAIYTFSYKANMARIVGRMHMEPKALWPALIRHYVMKIIFNYYLPSAVHYYLNWRGIDNRTRVEGYRLIVHKPGQKKETVFSISDPLLEATKILNRPYNRTMEYNMARLPAALLVIMRGALFQDRDADWKDTVNQFFGVGFPLIRELDTWEKTDLETYQKFMSMLGLAFVYQRNRTEVPEDNPAKALLKAMDLYVDWQKIKRKTDAKKAKKRAEMRGAL